MTMTSILLIMMSRESNLLLDQPCWLLVINLVTLDQLHRWFIIIIITIIIILLIIIDPHPHHNLYQTSTFRSRLSAPGPVLTLRPGTSRPRWHFHPQNWKISQSCHHQNQKYWKCWNALNFRPRLSLPADRESQTVDRYFQYNSWFSPFINQQYFSFGCQFSICLHLGVEKRGGQTACTTQACR